MHLFNMLKVSKSDSICKNIKIQERKMLSLLSLLWFTYGGSVFPCLYCITMFFLLVN